MARPSNTQAHNSQDKDLSSKSQQFRNTMMDSKIRARMEEMRLTRMFCDVTLVAGNVEIPAHKIILASSSDYFWSMFTINLKEKESSRIVTRPSYRWISSASIHKPHLAYISAIMV